MLQADFIILAKCGKIVVIHDVMWIIFNQFASEIMQVAIWEYFLS